MDKIKRLIQVVWHFLRNLFTREAKVPTEKPGKTWLDKMRERFATFRFVDTSLGGLNMPKFQPCPEGHGQKKRDSKAAGGAYYWCNTCQHHFFMLHP